MITIFNHSTSPDGALLKLCTGCGETKPHSEFSRNKSKWDGLHTHCKQCDAKYYRENTDKFRERNARYRRENPDKIREDNALYRIENADKLREYRIENADKFRERNARYRRENPDKLHEYYHKNAAKERERQARYSRENPGKVSEGQARWRQANPDKDRAKAQRRRATKRALPAQWTSTDAQRMLTYWGNRCAICSQHVEPNNAFYYLAQDHWIPIADPRPGNPGTVPCNILPLCHSKIGNALGCNNSKSNADPIAWLHSRYPDDPKLVTKILARIAKYFKFIVTDGGAQ